MEAEAFSTATIVLAGAGSLFGGSPVHTFDPDPSAAFSSTGGEETGLGDVIVRTKYNFAGGNGGQVVAVVRELDLVVMFFAGNYSDRVLFKIQEEFIPRYILPAVMED